MQNNFDPPVWVTQNGFRVQHCMCDVVLGRAMVHCQRNPLRKPKISRNRAILSDHFSGVKFCIGFFLARLFSGSALAFFVMDVAIVVGNCCQESQLC